MGSNRSVSGQPTLTAGGQDPPSRACLGGTELVTLDATSSTRILPSRTESSEFRRPKHLAVRKVLETALRGSSCAFSELI